jgi:hypothetical protein
MLRFTLMCPVSVNYAQLCNPAIAFICWLKIIQTTLQWQTRLAYCSLVLGKAFPTLPDYSTVLCTYILCCYAHMTKTRNPACVPKKQTTYHQFIVSLLIEALSIVLYGLERRRFALCWYVKFALTMLGHIIQPLILYDDLKIIQTTLQCQTRLAYCSLVLGKAFPTLPDYSTVLSTYILCW